MANGNERNIYLNDSYEKLRGFVRNIEELLSVKGLIYTLTDDKKRQLQQLYLDSRQVYEDYTLKLREDLNIINKLSDFITKYNNILENSECLNFFPANAFMPEDRARIMANEIEDTTRIKTEQATNVENTSQQEENNNDDTQNLEKLQAAIREKEKEAGIFKATPVKEDFQTNTPKDGIAGGVRPTGANNPPVNLSTEDARRLQFILEAGSAILAEEAHSDVGRRTQPEEAHNSQNNIPFVYYRNPYAELEKLMNRVADIIEDIKITTDYNHEHLSSFETLHDNICSSFGLELDNAEANKRANTYNNELNRLLLISQGREMSQDNTAHNTDSAPVAASNTGHRDATRSARSVATNRPVENRIQPEGDQHQQTYSAEVNWLEDIVNHIKDIIYYMQQTNDYIPEDLNSFISLRDDIQNHLNNRSGLDNAEQREAFTNRYFSLLSASQVRDMRQGNTTLNTTSNTARNTNRAPVATSNTANHDATTSASPVTNNRPVENRTPRNTRSDVLPQSNFRTRNTETNISRNKNNLMLLIRDIESDSRKYSTAQNTVARDELQRLAEIGKSVLRSDDSAELQREFNYISALFHKKTELINLTHKIKQAIDFYSQRNDESACKILQELVDIVNAVLKTDNLNDIQHELDHIPAFFDEKTKLINLTHKIESARDFYSHKNDRFACNVLQNLAHKGYSVLKCFDHNDLKQELDYISALFHKKTELINLKHEIEPAIDFYSQKNDESACKILQELVNIVNAVLRTDNLNDIQQELDHIPAFFKEKTELINLKREIESDIDFYSQKNDESACKILQELADRGHSVLKCYDHNDLQRELDYISALFNEKTKLISLKHEIESAMRLSPQQDDSGYNKKLVSLFNKIESVLTNNDPNYLTNKTNNLSEVSKPYIEVYKLKSKLTEVYQRVDKERRKRISKGDDQTSDKLLNLIDVITDTIKINERKFLETVLNNVSKRFRELTENTERVQNQQARGNAILGQNAHSSSANGSLAANSQAGPNPTINFPSRRNATKEQHQQARGNAILGQNAHSSLANGSYAHSTQPGFNTHINDSSRRNVKEGQYQQFGNYFSYK